MDYCDDKSSKETIESTSKQIYYYSYLPKHIKEGLCKLDNLKPVFCHESSVNPAHVVVGAIAVVGGKVNIPKLLIT